MKSIFLTVAILGGFTTSAMAADAVAELPVASTYNWSGAYVGGALGGNTIRGEDVSYGDGAKSDTGFSGAIYGGYNFQVNQWVFGVEGDVSFSGAKVDDGDYLLPLESKARGSIRGRVGYAIENIMPYFTAGLAVGSFRVDHNGGGSDIARETLTGYALGGGIEWGITQNLIARGEYIFSGYGKNDFHFSGNDIHEIKVQTHDFRIGLAYKF